MNYKVMTVGEDWIDLWDGDAIIDPDLPRHKSVDRVFVGLLHGFQVDDLVGLKVFLIARITTPEEVPSDA